MACWTTFYNRKCWVMAMTSIDISSVWKTCRVYVWEVRQYLAYAVSLFSKKCYIKIATAEGLKNPWLTDYTWGFAFTFQKINLWHIMRFTYILVQKCSSFLSHSTTFSFSLTPFTFYFPFFKAFHNQVWASLCFPGRVFHCIFSHTLVPLFDSVMWIMYRRREWRNLLLLWATTQLTLLGMLFTLKLIRCILLHHLGLSDASLLNSSPWAKWLTGVISGTRFDFKKLTLILCPLFLSLCI